MMSEPCKHCQNAGAKDGHTVQLLPPGDFEVLYSGEDGQSFREPLVAWGLMCGGDVIPLVLADVVIPAEQLGNGEVVPKTDTRA